MGTDGKTIVYPFRGIAQGLRRGDLHARTVAYVVALVVTAIAVGASLVLAGYRLEAPLTVLALALAAAAAERVSVRLTKTTELSISGIPALFAAVLFGPLAAGAVGAASMLGDPELTSGRDSDRAPRLKWATYTSTRFTIGAATGLAAHATIMLVPSRFGGLVAASASVRWRSGRSRPTARRTSSRNC